MEFPTFVYKCPGPHFGPPKTTYGTLDVADDSDLSAALKNGWHMTLKEAVDDFLGNKDNKPPTREEMLQQAEKVGLKVDKRWSNETLLAAVNEASKEQK